MKQTTLKRISRIALQAAFTFLMGSTAINAAALLFDDPLTTGKTIGIQDMGKGQFVSGGWKVTSSSDSIRYTAPAPIEDGAVEFDVIGLKPGDKISPLGQLVCIYDASSKNIENNPYKIEWLRVGDNGTGERKDEFKIAINTDGAKQFDDYSKHGPYKWNSETTYHFRLGWKDGIARFSVSGADSDDWPIVYRGVFKPKTHDIRIGASPKNKAIIGAVYSNVKVYDYGSAPRVICFNNPARGQSCKSLTPIIDWTGERHDSYQVRVTNTIDPGKSVIWDSGQIESANNYCVSGALKNGLTYYAHVRLHNGKGWGSWSQPNKIQIDAAGTISAPKFGEYEIALTTKNKYANPYLEVELAATFTGPTQTIKVSGFWDGGNLYKIRMAPTEPGNWTWKVSSNDSQLNGKTGSFACRQSDKKGFVRVSTAYPYTFEWTDGTPFFLLGDTIWHLWYNVRFADGSAQKIIDARAAQKFNYAQSVVHNRNAGEGGPIYLKQAPNGKRFDCDTLNPLYFQFIDEKIDYMNAKGMVAGVFFAWGNEGYSEYQSEEQYKRYIKYLVARYGAKNVFWIVTGEFEEPHEPDGKWISYMDTVRDNDPYNHPISMHTINTTDRFGSVPSHSFVSHQKKGTPEYLRSLVAKSRAFGKPVVNLEYGYESTTNVHRACQDADQLRMDHWALTLAGGYGVYGNAVPGFMTFHKSLGFNLNATDSIGANQMTILYDFFTSTDFRKLVPSQQLVDKGICACSPNEEYIVQILSGGTVTVDLSAATGEFNVDWFDPKTGQRTSAATTTGGAKRAFKSPETPIVQFVTDWILHIHRGEIAQTDKLREDLGD
ncbi:MAG: DUF4038 domain-containing protein [Armatimonadota bacterium]|nr:DUF4038 domain-containing protein [Armatimonadota bacterium]